MWRTSSPTFPAPNRDRVRNIVALREQLLKKSPPVTGEIFVRCCPSKTGDHHIVTSALRVIALQKVESLHDAADSMTREVETKVWPGCNEHLVGHCTSVRNPPAFALTCAIESHPHQSPRTPVHQPRLSAPELIEPSGQGDRSKVSRGCQARGGKAASRNRRHLKVCGQDVDAPEGAVCGKAANDTARCLPVDTHTRYQPTFFPQA